MGWPTVRSRSSSRSSMRHDCDIVTSVSMRQPRVFDRASPLTGHTRTRDEEIVAAGRRDSGRKPRYGARSPTRRRRNVPARQGAVGHHDGGYRQASGRIARHGLSLLRESRIRRIRCHRPRSGTLPAPHQRTDLGAHRLGLCHTGLRCSHGARGTPRTDNRHALRQRR